MWQEAKSQKMNKKKTKWQPHVPHAVCIGVWTIVVGLDGTNDDVTYWTGNATSHNSARHNPGRRTDRHWLAEWWYGNDDVNGYADDITTQPIFVPAPHVRALAIFRSLACRVHVQFLSDEKKNRPRNVSWMHNHICLELIIKMLEEENHWLLGVSNAEYNWHNTGSQLLVEGELP